MLTDCAIAMTAESAVKNLNSCMHKPKFASDTPQISDTEYVATIDLHRIIQ